MRKKILFTCLSFLMCFGLIFGFGLKQSHNYACADNEYNIYTIQNSENKVSVSSSLSSFSDIFDSFDLALLAIENDCSLNSEETIYIYFDNFSLELLNENSIVFANSSFTYHLSGKVSNASENAIIEINSETPISLVMEDLAFDCPNSKYAVYLSSKQNFIFIGGDLSHTSDYLINFVTDNTFTATEKELVNTIKISLPYNLCKTDIIYLINSSSKNKIELLAEFDYYNIYSIYYNSTKYLSASAYIKVNYETNGGTFETSSYNNFTAIYSSNFTFPQDTDISKNYSMLKGWFGKVKYNNQTYYFDSSMLEKFKAISYDFSQINNYFTTDLSLVNNEKSFTAYTHLNNTQNEHLKFFLENNLNPTYIAKWQYYSYSITLQTNTNETQYNPLTLEFGAEISLPTPEQIGYEFVGWYSDNKLTTPFTLKTMPAYNFTVYAKWEVLSYTINFNLNGGNGSISPIIAKYGENVTRPADPTRTGYNFAGWYSDANLTESFEFIAMPAYNQTAYAKWNIIKFNVYFNTVGASFSGASSVSVNYGQTVNKPANPTKNGYTFLGWYTAKDSDTLFDFDSQIFANTTIYARWQIKFYEITLVSSFDIGVTSQSYEYQSELSLPTGFSKTGYNFIGWFTNEELTISADTLTTMPAQNFTVYAKWEEKATVSLTLNSKEFNYGDVVVYKNFSELSGFEVFYNVNGVWTKKAPTDVGTYNIKVQRPEDYNYKAYEQVFENIIKINPIQRDFSIIIILLYFVCALEIVTILFVKFLRRKKSSISYSVVFGTWFISTSQFVHLIIISLVSIALFIMLFYELLRTHRTAYNENFAKSKYDTRERFKEELEFQINVKANPDYEYETKTKESFGDKYTAEDIENMLIHDTYNEDRLKAKNKKNQISNDDEDVNSDFLTTNNEASDLDLNIETKSVTNEVVDDGYNAEDENERYRREMYDYEINENDESEDSVLSEDNQTSLETPAQDNDNENNFESEIERQNRELEELSKQISSNNENSDLDSNN